MPYNPGVQDISGQLRAQGILGASQAYGGGMQAISQGIQARKLKEEQDAALLAKASSTEKFIKAHPELFGGEETVKQMIATNPQESPIAKYNRLATVMADTVTGKKLEADQAQAAQAKQQMAAQAFVMQQQQLKAQQEAQQRARFEQMLGGVQPAGGGGQGMAQPPPGMNQSAPSGVLAGIPGAGPAPAGAPGMAPQPDPMTARALQYYKMTGRVPDSNAMSAMIGDESRQTIADIGGRYRDMITDERNASREKIAAAEEARKAAELAAKGAPPKFTQHPETGIWMMTQNGQTQPLPGQVAKDPTFARLDQALAAKRITPAEYAAAEKKLIAHRGTFSPNGQQMMAQQVGAAMNGQPAPAAVNVDDFFGSTPAAPAYKTPQDLLAAVRAGKLSAAEAKAIAQQNSW